MNHWIIHFWFINDPKNSEPSILPNPLSFPSLPWLGGRCVVPEQRPARPREDSWRRRRTPTMWPIPPTDLAVGFFWGLLMEIFMGNSRKEEWGIHRKLDELNLAQRWGRKRSKDFVRFFSPEDWITSNQQDIRI